MSITTTDKSLKADYANRERSLRFGDINLGIVCPMANEGGTAAEFVLEVLERCRSYDFRSQTFFAVVDRASTDGTIDILEKLKIDQPELVVVWAPGNRNVVDAYIRGYREAIEANCNWIIEIDAGYSHQPSDLPQFFSKMAEGYDCVFGSRFCDGGVMEGPAKRRVVSRGGTLLANLLLGTKMKDMTSGFEMFTRSALQQVLNKGIHSKAHFFQTKIRAHCRRLRLAEVPIHYRVNSDSVNQRVLRDALSNLWRMVRLRWSGQL